MWHVDEAKALNAKPTKNRLPLVFLIPSSKAVLTK